MVIIRLIPPLLVSLFILLLSACSSTTTTPVGTAVPKGSTVYPGHYKIGSPYKVDSTWYYPKPDPSYEETGIASWYGPGFHGKRTANGDKYNQKSFTAAHRTLPLPSMVKITNLANNRSVIAMVNDRGPFSKKRIIDVSEKAAIALDMKRQGTGKVRVQFLPQETKEMLIALHLPPVEGKYATAANEYQEPTIPEGKGAATLITSAMAAEPAQTMQSAQHIFIQVGAYNSRNGAEKVASTLHKFGRVGVKPMKIKGKDLYRVRVGPLKDAKYANQVLDQIINLGNPHAITIGNNG